MPKNEGSRPLFWLCGERPTRCSAERGGRIASGEIERPSQPLRSTKTYHRKGMRGIKRPVDKKLLSGLFAILIQIVSFLQWRRNRLCRSYFFMMKSNQRGAGGVSTASGVGTSGTSRRGGRGRATGMSASFIPSQVNFYQSFCHQACVLSKCHQKHWKLCGQNHHM